MAYIYQSGAWAAYDSKKCAVNTTIFTTYPFTIKSPTTPVNATIYGNMMQTGTPTPTIPIQPSECGDLETTGEHTGQYKIPILNNSQTTNVYLGEVQTTRKIGKYIFTGDENITRSVSSNNVRMYYSISNAAGASLLYCTHFVDYAQAASYPPVGYCNFNNVSNFIMGVDGTEFETAADFKTWLTQQYAAGTPVCVWYVLETETTGIVNEPIRKIGDYADTVTASIPVTINSDTVDVSTTLKPSAVEAPSLSWGTGDDYKYSSGAWD